MAQNALSVLELTPLERDLLERFHKRYAKYGFPSVGQITVLSRTNTGAGRMTRLTHDGVFEGDGAEVPLGRFSYLVMEGIESHAEFSIYVNSNKLSMLEIVALLGKWDGVERPWKVADPDTGECAELEPV